MFSSFVIDQNKMAKRQGNKKNKKMPSKLVQNEQAATGNNESFYEQDPKVQKKLIRSHTHHLNTSKGSFQEDDKCEEYYKYSDYRMADTKGMRDPNAMGQQSNLPMSEDSFMKMKMAAEMNQKNNPAFNPAMNSPENNNILNNMQNYPNDPMKGIFEIMQQMSYTSTNQVNAQLFQGMLNAQQTKGGLQNIPGLGQGLNEISQLNNKAYSPEVLQMIKRFIQTASGGNLSYGGYQQNNYADSFNTKAKFPLPKAAYHVGIAYHIWYRQGNVDKDPTQYARKIKQMIIIKSQRQEMQDQGSTKYPEYQGQGNGIGNFQNEPSQQQQMKPPQQQGQGVMGLNSTLTSELKETQGMRTQEEINQQNMQIMESLNNNQQNQQQQGLQQNQSQSQNLKESPAASQTGGFHQKMQFNTLNNMNQNYTMTLANNGNNINSNGNDMALETR